MRMETHSKGSHSIKEGMYWEQRYTLSMNRLNRSMEMLARLRVLSSGR
jgi:hypothetical protein